MNTQKLLIGTIAGGITLFVTGFIIYVWLFGNSNIGMEPSAEGIMLENIKFPTIILMELVYGLLLTIILLWRGAGNFSSGLSAGALVGLLIGFTFGLDLYSTTGLVNFNYVLFSAITYAVRYGLAGGVIAFVIKSKN
jgi:hypothetical protein